MFTNARFTERSFDEEEDEDEKKPKDEKGKEKEKAEIQIPDSSLALELQVWGTAFYLVYMLMFAPRPFANWFSTQRKSFPCHWFRIAHAILALSTRICPPWTTMRTSCRSVWHRALRRHQLNLNNFTGKLAKSTILNGFTALKVGDCFFFCLNTHPFITLLGAGTFRSHRQP